MNSHLTFDEAIEILEISDVESLTVSDLKGISKKAKKRWHPDKIAYLNDDELAKKYQITFQKIDDSIELLRQYLSGEFQKKTSREYENTKHREPYEIIRENASRMQSAIKELWEKVTSNKFKYHEEVEILSDGFSWREYIEMDFREEIATLSIISFFSYFFSFGIIGMIFAFLFPPVTLVIAIFGMFLLFFCILGFLPLSRFWLPDKIVNVMLWFINFGLSVQHNLLTFLSRNIVVNLYLGLVSLFAKGIKWVLLFPIYQIAMASVGDKRGGVVKQTNKFYAGIADWKIPELLNSSPSTMNPDDLYMLSHLYGELLDVRSL